MLVDQRQTLILERVGAHGAVRVADLSAELGVSDMTIRRDIADLSARGLLRKVHGGAVDARPSAHEPGFASKQTIATAQKLAIADAAIDLIPAGASIALSAGTTTFALATRLAQRPDLHPLAVVTNSLPVADALHAASDVGDVVLTGGSRTPSDALVGPLAVAALETLHVDLLFLGAHGLDVEAGLTTPNMLEAETNRALARSARRTVVVADSSKWGTLGMARFLTLDEVDVLVTDENLSTDAAVALADADVRVIYARATPTPSSRPTNRPAPEDR